MLRNSKNKSLKIQSEHNFILKTSYNFDDKINSSGNNLISTKKKKLKRNKIQKKKLHMVNQYIPYFTQNPPAPKKKVI